MNIKKSKNIAIANAHIKKDLLFYFFVIVLSILIPIIVLRLWEGNFRIPLVYEKDAIGWGTIVKNFIDGGTIYQYKNYAAPFSGEIGFQPNFNLIYLLILWGMSHFSHSYGLILNCAYILTFPAVAVSASFILRKFGIQRSIALVGALLYTALPYHFYRSISHLNLSCYALIPFACWITYEIITSSDPLKNRIFSKRFLFMFLICLLLGLSDLYYSVFACAAIVIATLYVVFREKKFGKFVDMSGLIGGCALGILCSTVLWYVSYRPDQGIAISDSRSLYDLEVYGLKLSTLLLPDSNHRIRFLADISKKYIESTPFNYESRLASLGFVGVAGLLFSIYIFVIKKNKSELDQQVSIFGKMNIFLLLFGINSGINIYFGLLFSTAIRCYNRISVFIAFFSIASFCFLLQKIRIKITNPILSKGFILILAVITVFGILDQTNDKMIPDYKNIAAEYNSDSEFAKTIMNTVPKDSLVFMLPVIPTTFYGNVKDIQAYDIYKLYLQTQDIHWSLGYGRALTSQWVENMGENSVDVMIKKLVLTNFSCIVIDSNGYTDAGLNNLINEINTSYERVGIKALPIYSYDGRYILYNILDYSKIYISGLADKQLGKESMFSKYIFYNISDGVYSKEESADGLKQWRWLKPKSKIKISNISGSSIAADVTFELATYAPGPYDLTFTYGEQIDHFIIDSSKQIYRFKLNLLPGTNEITIRTNAPSAEIASDPRKMTLRMTNFEITAD